MADTSSLPPELLIAIFTHACTDSGRTGRALSLVSRYFHSICFDTGVDIQSVALHGVDEMRSFLGDVLKRRVDRTRRVRYLCLSDQKDVQALSRTTTPPELESSSSSSSSSSERQTTPTVVTLIKEIIRIVSPTLEILTVLCDGYWPTHFPPSVPALRELTMFPMGEESFYQLHLLPNLERLHISWYSIAADDLRQNLAQFVPSLTHLRMSNVQRCREDVEATLQDFIDGGNVNLQKTVDEGADIEEFKFPSTLQKIIVSFNTEFGPSRRRGMIWDTREEAVQRLRRLAAQQQPSSNSSKRLLVMPEPEERHQSQYYEVKREEFEKLEREWEERVNGGVGCWVDSAS